jgi:thymidylate kinase
MKPRLILFLGMDGSGKTTLAQYLCENLRERGNAVQYIWYFTNERSRFRNLLRRFSILKPERKREERVRPNQQSCLERLQFHAFKTVYPLLILSDYFIFTLFNFWIPSLLKQGQLFIADRYFYDVILSFADEFTIPKEKMERSLRRYHHLFPHPDQIFFLSVLPDMAFARKTADYSSLTRCKEIHRRYLELYELLRASHEKIRFIDTSTSDKTEAQRAMDEYIKLLE